MIDFEIGNELIEVVHMKSKHKYTSTTIILQNILLYT